LAGMHAFVPRAATLHAAGGLVNMEDQRCIAVESSACHMSYVLQRTSKLPPCDLAAGGKPRGWLLLQSSCPLFIMSPCSLLLLEPC
jgi:hypothetical protein